MNSPSGPAEEFLKVADALCSLGKALGLSVHITVPDSEAWSVEATADDDEAQALKQRQREDFTWLETQLTQDPNKFAQLRGKYAAVHNEQIVAVSEDEKMARLGAVQVLGSVEPGDILVVSICVEGSDSEQSWLSTKARLGMT